jgi:hypothetical protein
LLCMRNSKYHMRYIKHSAHKAQENVMSCQQALMEEALS